MKATQTADRTAAVIDVAGAAPRSVRLRNRGFTLIEILVVLVIIGIIVGVALIKIGALGRSPAAKRAAEQLSALATLASQQAVMDGQQYGLLVSRHGYAFYVFDGEFWQPVQDDEMFRPRTLGKDVIFKLHLEGEPVNLAKTDITPSETSTTTADSADLGLGSDTDLGSDNSDNTGAKQNDNKSNDQANQPKPQIALLSSGEITPFRILVSDTADPSAQYEITASLSKGVTLKAPGEQDAH